MVSSACLILAGCATDKISFASEVGGGGTPGLPGSPGDTGTPGDPGTPGTAGDPGAFLGDGGTLSNGLGVTGDGGVLANVFGTDPIGGTIDGLLGDNNALTQIIGTPDDGTNRGLVPELAAAVAGDPDAVVLNGGLGVTGTDGLIADLTGSDLGGAVLGTQGVIPAGVAGGNDGLLGALLGDHVTDPLLAPVAQAVPTSTILDGLAQAPQLGVTGTRGVVDAVLGTDLVGNLVGTEGAVSGVLAGGSDGAIGSQLPAGDAPLAPLGDAVVQVLDIVAGSEPSPLAGALPALPGLPSGGSSTDPVGAVADQIGALPVVGTAIGTVLDSVSGGLPDGGGLPSGGLPDAGAVTGALAPVTDALAPVTDTVSTLPAVGTTLGGLLGTP